MSEDGGVGDKVRLGPHSFYGFHNFERSVIEYAVRSRSGNDPPLPSLHTYLKRLGKKAKFVFRFLYFLRQSTCFVSDTKRRFCTRVFI